MPNCTPIFEHRTIIFDLHNAILQPLFDPYIKRFDSFLTRLITNIHSQRTNLLSKHVAAQKAPKEMKQSICRILETPLYSTETKETKWKRYSSNEVRRASDEDTAGDQWLSWLD